MLKLALEEIYSLLVTNREFSSAFGVRHLNEETLGLGKDVDVMAQLPKLPFISISIVKMIKSDL